MPDQRYSDFLGQTPSRELVVPVGTEFLLVSVPLGTVPDETYETRYITVANLGGGGVVDVSASRDLVLSDADNVLYSTPGSPEADVTLTIPADSEVMFPIGTIVNIVLKDTGSGDANTVSVTGRSGSVTLNSVLGGTRTLTDEFTAMSLQKVAADEWVVV